MCPVSGRTPPERGRLPGTGMENKGALFAVAAPLILFKIWFAILLLSYAPNRDTATWIAATHWPLLIIVALLIAPGIAVYRLLRARAKREHYRRAEWMVPSTKRLPKWSEWETVSGRDGDD